MSERDPSPATSAGSAVSAPDGPRTGSPETGAFTAAGATSGGYGPSSGTAGAPTPDAVTDETLMRAWSGGAADAFDSLYARHRAALWRYVLNRTGDESRARELFQDIWLRVVHGRSGYTPDAPFRAWLYRIARNRVIDHYRRQPETPHETLDEHTTIATTEIAPPLQPDEIASLAERGDVLQRALARLPDEQREAIVLQHVAGMSLAEIAEVTGERTETVKSRLRYAKTKLRQLLRASP